jgi:hypothetical protein
VSRHLRRLRRLRTAGGFVGLGLVIELLTLRWAHPTAFIAFALGSGACLGAGILVFLATLFATGPERP